MLLMAILGLVVLPGCKGDIYIEGEGFAGKIFNRSSEHLANPVELEKAEVIQFEKTFQKSIGPICEDYIQSLEICPACTEYNQRETEKCNFVLQHLSEYKRQYYGYNDEGNKGIEVYGIYAKALKDSTDWQSPMQVIHRGGGEAFWWLTYDIEMDSITYFSINLD